MLKKPGRRQRQALPTGALPAWGLQKVRLCNGVLMLHRMTVIKRLQGTTVQPQRVGAD